MSNTLLRCLPNPSLPSSEEALVGDLRVVEWRIDLRTGTDAKGQADTERDVAALVGLLLGGRPGVEAEVEAAR